MLYDLNQFYGFLKASGPDAKTFLQGQLSCDMEKIDANNSSLSVICDPKGRIQSLFRIIKIDDDYFLRMPKSILEHAHNHLKKYAIFSKVEITLCDTGIYAYASFDGCEHETKHQVSPWENAYECYTTDKIEGANTEIIAWHKARIEAGIAEIYPETIDQFTPHNLNLQSIAETLSFDKGCYTGQEIIARMHYRGTLKQHMYLASCEKSSIVAAYSAVIDENQKTVGHVVDSARCDNKCVMLVSLKDKALNSTLSVNDNLRLKMNHIPTGSRKFRIATRSRHVS